MVLRSRASRRKRACSRRNRGESLRAARLRVEILEDRTLPDASPLAAVDFSTLQVDPNSYDPHSILVRFKPDAMPAGARALPGTELGRQLDLVPGLWEVTLDEGVEAAAALAAYQADPNVLYAEFNFTVFVSLIPDDPEFPQLYGLHNTGQTGGTPDADIDAPEAWDVHTGTGNTIVAVIDTGVDYNHPDLAGNMWTNVGEQNGTAGVDDDGNGYVDDIHGYDFVNNDGNPIDDHGHGTHVAGTIGAVGNNTVGVTGVIWNVQIMALKFLNSNGSGSLSAAISAVNYAVANGASISNNSWGGGPFIQSLYDAIQAAGVQDHLFVAAAGNSGINTDLSPAYPASYNLPNIISVAATNHADGLASFSNFGLVTVDLGAPGVGIRSTLPGGGYGNLSGTSMASPHVAGVAALVRDLNPTWTFQQVKDVILNTADPIAALQGKSVTGGRLNAADAVNAALPVDLAGPRISFSDPSAGANPPVSSVHVAFNESIDVSTFTVADIVSFTGPGGPIAVSSVQVVPGTFNREFNIVFAAQSALGGYTMVLGPNIEDEAGNPMNQDNDAVNGETPGDQFTVQFQIEPSLVVCATGMPLAITDLNTTFSFVFVDQHLPISDFNLRLNVTHPNVGDLVVRVFSPGTSTEMILSNHRGGSGDNFVNTIFDDEAAVSIADGAAPFTGSFRPETALSVIDGDDIYGWWLLSIQDTVVGNQGTLNGWCLMLVAGGGGGPPTGGPPVANNDSATTVEETAVAINVLANDSDPDNDPLTIIGVTQGGAGSVVINANQTVTYTPNLNFQGVDSFTYTISDGNGNEDTATVSVSVSQVNDAPIAVDDVAVGKVNTPITFGTNPPALTANDIDPDGGFLSVAAVSNAVHGTVVLNANGTVTFFPEQNYLGPASFQYTVTDGALTDVGQVTINISTAIFFSAEASGTLVNSDGSSLSFGDEDILRLTVNSAGHQYSLYFDGSDVGLTGGLEDIDAFTILPDNQIVISTVGSFSVPGFGGAILSGGGEDLLLFTPSQLGNNTAGTWSIYLDGSVIGLEAPGEKIDAVAVLFDGTIVISTEDNVSVAGVTAQDEDLISFKPFRIGPNPVGFWKLYFDGTAVGLGDGDNEDVNGLYVQGNGSFLFPTLYFSTRGDFSVPGVSGTNEDVFAFTPTSLGSTTAGTFNPALALDGSLYGLESFDLDGVFLGNVLINPSSPLSFSSAPPESSTAPADSGGSTPGAAFALAPATPQTLLRGEAVVEIFRTLARPPLGPVDGFLPPVPTPLPPLPPFNRPPSWLLPPLPRTAPVVGEPRALPGLPRSLLQPPPSWETPLEPIRGPALPF
jgi:serine protease